MTRVVVATDIDHTMLPRGLDPDGVPGVVEALLSMGIPVVPVTAKTIEETLLVMEAVGLDPRLAPAAAENGAVIFAAPGLLPEPHATEEVNGYELELYYPRPTQPGELESLLEAARRACPGIVSISEMSPTQLAGLTGLPPRHAEAARKRRATLALYHPDRACLERAQEALERAGASTALGATFLHAYTHRGKAEAIRFLRRHPHYYDALIVALGDSPVDKGMLEEADLAIVVPRNGAPRVKPARDYIVAPYPAPEGWVHAVRGLLLTI